MIVVVVDEILIESDWFVYWDQNERKDWRLFFDVVVLLYIVELNWFWMQVIVLKWNFLLQKRAIFYTSFIKIIFLCLAFSPRKWENFIRIILYVIYEMHIFSPYVIVENIKIFFFGIYWIWKIQLLALA